MRSQKRPKRPISYVCVQKVCYARSKFLFEIICGHTFFILRTNNQKRNKNATTQGFINTAIVQITQNLLYTNRSKK